VIALLGMADALMDSSKMLCLISEVDVETFHGWQEVSLSSIRKTR
jgi:hypothetical protein